MSDHHAGVEQVPTFCALCISRCGAIATLKHGRLTALSPDPSHPTGQALCIKGKVAAELVYHPDRLLHPERCDRLAANFLGRGARHCDRTPPHAG